MSGASSFHIHVSIHVSSSLFFFCVSSSVWTPTKGGRSFCWSAVRIRLSTSESHLASQSTVGSCGWMTGRGRSVGGTTFPDTPEGSHRNRCVQNSQLCDNIIISSCLICKMPLESTKRHTNIFVVLCVFAHTINYGSIHLESWAARTSCERFSWDERLSRFTTCSESQTDCRVPATVVSSGWTLKQKTNGQCCMFVSAEVAQEGEVCSRGGQREVDELQQHRHRPDRQRNLKHQQTRRLKRASAAASVKNDPKFDLQFFTCGSKHI